MVLWSSDNPSANLFVARRAVRKGSGRQREHVLALWCCGGNGAVVWCCVRVRAYVCVCVVVDKDCPSSANYHVYDDGTCVYDAMLNQTVIKKNANKFYILQVLQHDTTNKFYFWCVPAPPLQLNTTKLNSCCADKLVPKQEHVLTVCWPCADRVPKQEPLGPRWRKGPVRERPVHHKPQHHAV